VSGYESKTYGQIIDELYLYLGVGYRNEYYYMNSLFCSLGSGVVLSQVRVGGCVADFVELCSGGVVYEIKSDLDNYRRLSNQLCGYYRAFSKVSVLVSESEVGRVLRVLGTFGVIGSVVGVSVLFGDGSVSFYRVPCEFDINLDHVVLFKLLRKGEYESVILGEFGELPCVEPVYYFRACLECFKLIPVKRVQYLVFCELCKRRVSSELVGRVPFSLRSVVYFSNLSCNVLERLLLTKYKC
jgi:hypothetical protein